MVVAFALYWFQPWRLFTSTEVHEALPVLAVASAPITPPVPSGPPAQPAVKPPSGPAGAPLPLAPVAIPPAPVAASTATAARRAAATRPVTPAGARPPGPASAAAPVSTPDRAVALATGSLISHEHETSGTVRLIRLADGRRVLTLEGLSTSDGPALHVWLTDAPVRPGSDGWKVFDDGRYVDLGALRGNRGDQVYEIPAGTDLAGLNSVSIWCERFAVSFGAAALTPS